ncbi:MAG: pyrimidine dimer DNA glycosylase/endonuclease V [Candidatus Omnitrophota bacterium]
MRLWSIHPQYLDTKGLLALWREALLAKCILENKTKGYQKHPQLLRFRNQKSPLGAINFYLKEIYNESRKRNFHFDSSKIGAKICKNSIPVTTGQIKYEFKHLLSKLKQRDRIKYDLLKSNKNIQTHPVFQKSTGGIEFWEKL